MSSYLIFGISLAFAAAVQPGPLQAYIVSQTLRRGWRAALPAALAPLISDGPIVLAVLLLLKTIPAALITFLRIGGGIFLLYLGLKALAAWRRYGPDPDPDRQPGSRTLRQAVGVNLLNPAPYLAWSLVMGPLLLDGWAQSPAHGLVLLAGFYLTLVLTLSGTVMLFTFARGLGPGISKFLLGLSGMVLLGFGIYQLGAGIVYWTG